MNDRFENFIRAIKMGNIKNAKLFYDGEFLSYADEYGLQPIHWASLCYNSSILNWMLKLKCDIESPSTNRWRPIHFATFIGNHEMMKILIKNSCELGCQTEKGESVLDIAKDDCDHEFIDKILNDWSNMRIGLSMGLKCGVKCDHNLCMRSMIQGKVNKGEKLCNLGNERYKVKDSQSNRLFIYKSILKKYLCDPRSVLLNISQFQTELNHDNIVKYYGSIETPTKWNIYMEWMDKGSIDDEICKTGALTEDRIARYSKDILQAVAFLHDNKIIHKNITTTKILIDNNGGCKLLMSISSCLLADHEKCETETDLLLVQALHFTAPEQINGRCSYSGDIWAVGVTVVHMLTGTSRYCDFSEFEASNYIDPLSNHIQIFINVDGNKEPRSMSNQMQKFIDNMVKNDPNERATADELLNYHLIKNVPIECEINNSNMNESINNYFIDRKKCIDLINNYKIGVSMGFTCSTRCDHKFCLLSVIATDFKNRDTIGQGQFGSVCKMKDSNSDREIAMKTIILADKNNEDETKPFENNINNYREDIIHRNIVEYYGAIRNSEQMFIFMEFIDGETLRKKIAKNPLPVKNIKNYSQQILEGVEFLHEKNIIHRDIKSDNILLTKDEIIKIADFGLSSFLRTLSNYEKSTFCGTPNYMAPEVIIGENKYNRLADIWSVGATVIEMASGKSPYEGEELYAIIYKIGTEKKLEYPRNISNEMKDFLDLMIQANPEDRKDAKTLLTCGFLN